MGWNEYTGKQNPPRGRTCHGGPLKPFSGIRTTTRNKKDMKLVILMKGRHETQQIYNKNIYIYINTSNYTKHTALMKILLAVFVCYFLLCVNTTKKATHTKTYKIQKVPLWLITLRLVI